MAWSNSWIENSGEDAEKDEDIVKEAHSRFKYCEDWEAPARVNFDYDYKFANADTHNKYQWDTALINTRQDEGKPILTVNKVQQHNLLIINDAKMNKPGVRIRPVGDEATFEAAQVYQDLVYHIEYISSAEHVYDNGLKWQVEAGIGYWRIQTDYIDNKTFNQEIYIKRIRDPRSVYKDPDVNELDTSDARYGFVFEDEKIDLYKAKYPDFKDVGGSSVLGNVSLDWFSKDHVRVAEYYRKRQKKDKLIAFLGPDGQQQIGFYSALTAEGKQHYQQVKKEPTSQERDVLNDEIEWFKIAGAKIIDRGKWLGKYIPLIPIVGIETVIDGVLDRKGHTRALINPQQIYNWNTSANQEYGALQTKSPWVAPSAAIEGYEEYYKTANSINHAYLPYNHIDDDGKPIPPPARPGPPVGSPAYSEQMRIAENEMMMASGQYQAQFGENENAKSGVAINARQRQGDRATYHFIDSQAIAVALTGKMIVDLIPKIYDTERIIQIMARNGKQKKIQIAPNAADAHQQLPQDTTVDPAKRVEEIIFNPNIGTYDIQADTGPSFATKRNEGFNALTQIASQNKDFMNMIGGDIYFKNADFPDSDILAERYARIIPPNVRGEGPDPQTEQVMHQASDKIEQLTKLLTDAQQKLADRDRELTIKENEFKMKGNVEILEQLRLDYDALNKRLTALGNSGPAVSVEQIQPLVRQAIVEALKAGGPYPPEALDNAPGVHEGGMVPGQPEEELANAGEPAPQDGAPEGQDSLPDVPGSRLAPDGQHYVQQNGQYHRVEMQ